MTLTGGGAVHLAGVLAIGVGVGVLHPAQIDGLPFTSALSTFSGAGASGAASLIEGASKFATTAMVFAALHINYKRLQNVVFCSGLNHHV